MHHFYERRKEKTEPLEVRLFFAEHGSDEIVRSGIDGIIALLVLRGDRIGFAFELGIEARHDAVQEGLLFGRKGRFVTEGVNEFLGKMGGIPKGLLVRAFTYSNRRGSIIAPARLVGFEAAYFGNLTIVVLEVFLAFHEGMLLLFAPRTYHGFNTLGMFDFSHCLWLLEGYIDCILYLL